MPPNEFIQAEPASRLGFIQAFYVCVQAIPMSVDTFRKITRRQCAALCRSVTVDGKLQNRCA